MTGVLTMEYCLYCWLYSIDWSVGWSVDWKLTRVLTELLAQVSVATLHLALFEIRPFLGFSASDHVALWGWGALQWALPTISVPVIGNDVDLALSLHPKWGPKCVTVFIWSPGDNYTGTETGANWKDQEKWWEPKLRGIAQAPKRQRRTAGGEDFGLRERSWWSWSSL